MQGAGSRVWGSTRWSVGGVEVGAKNEARFSGRVPLAEPAPGAVGRTWAEKDGRSPFQRFCYTAKNTATKSKNRRHKVECYIAGEAELMSSLPFALIATRSTWASSLVHPDRLRSNFTL